MASPSLPCDVRDGIRNHWDNINSPLQVMRSALKENSGINVIFEIDWGDLLSHLGSDCPDKSEFVPFVANVVRVFVDGLQDTIDLSWNPDLPDALCENVEGDLRVFIGVTDKEGPTVSWAATNQKICISPSRSRGFQVNLPRGPMVSSVKMQSSFITQLNNCIDDPQFSLDDRADVSIEATNKRSATIEEPRPLDIVPHISTLPRPGHLLLKPPYHLTVYGGSKTTVEVHCSHSPTLELLEEYLRKWRKLNYQDIGHPHAIKVKLHQSSFGLGVMYDRLIMTARDRTPEILVTPMIVLPFVEGVLGYKSVSVDGSSWVFRRDTELIRHSQ
ncbi:uncharacterized protein F4812DRAFT_446562 [Daldinia caldariorum]|uniref:uncharacterized protein n=1 Tax=Daldinia caldariorum TaxID=326644 RepID=UPI002008CF6E|nr:uncharacterized protein F4812DRAFT_446562 [Daldinia caldariorum]KAI1463567.1 hypothetical protein F4812DRAFT_446562 [Daldinia caldariorum]